MASSGINVRTQSLRLSLWSQLSCAHRNALLIDYIQVLRWSALGAGIFYGVYHQAGIKAQLKVRHIDNEYEKQQSLIQKAKAEWAKKTMPKEKTDPSAGEFFVSVVEEGDLGLGSRAGDIGRVNKRWWW